MKAKLFFYLIIYYCKDNLRRKILYRSQTGVSGMIVRDDLLLETIFCKNHFVHC